MSPRKKHKHLTSLWLHFPICSTVALIHKGLYTSITDFQIKSPDGHQIINSFLLHLRNPRYFIIIAVVWQCLCSKVIDVYSKCCCKVRKEWWAFLCFQRQSTKPHHNKLQLNLGLSKIFPSEEKLCWLGRNSNAWNKIDWKIPRSVESTYDCKYWSSIF